MDRVRLSHYLLGSLSQFGVDLDEKLSRSMADELCSVVFLLGEQISTSTKSLVRGKPKQAKKEADREINLEEVEKARAIIETAGVFSEELLFALEQESSLLKVALSDERPKNQYVEVIERVRSEQSPYVDPMEFLYENLIRQNLYIHPMYLFNLARQIEDWDETKKELKSEFGNDPDAFSLSGYKYRMQCDLYIHTAYVSKLLIVVSQAIEKANGFENKNDQTANWLNGFFKARNDVDPKYQGSGIRTTYATIKKNKGVLNRLNLFNVCRSILDVSGEV